MQNQVKKLAVICNACFWLTIIFRYWKNARNIQQDVLNTIIILGMVAIVANVAWLIFVFAKNKRNMAFAGGASTAPSSIYKLLGNAFNFISLAAQVFYIIMNFL